MLTIVFSFVLTLSLHLAPCAAVAGDIAAVRNLVSKDPRLLNERMFGFEGHDVYGIVSQ